MIEHRSRVLLGLREHAPLQRAQSVAVTHAPGHGAGDTESLPELPFASPLDWRPGTPTRRSPHPTPPPSRARTPGGGRTPAEGLDGTVPTAEASPERGGRPERARGAGASWAVPGRGPALNVEPPSVGSPRVHTLTLQSSARSRPAEEEGAEGTVHGSMRLKAANRHLASNRSWKHAAHPHGQRGDQRQHHQAPSSDSEDAEVGCSLPPPLRRWPSLTLLFSLVQRPLTVDELHADATEALRRANDEAVHSYNAKRRRQRTLAPSQSEFSLHSPGWVA